MGLPKISVVFPNLEGEKKNLKNLLNSVKTLTYPQKLLEVIMVDNGSKDDSVKFVKTHYPEVKIFTLAKNYGFAKAVNYGIGKPTGSYIFVTNNDVRLEKNCLPNLVKFSQDHPEIGVTGPIVFENSQKTPISTLKYNFYTGLFRKLESWQESDWISGAGMFFPKKLWQKLGGFDEGFFFTFEDLDFCLRVKKLGFKVIHAPTAVIWHNEGTTVNKPEFYHFKYYEGYKSKLRLLLKHGNFLQIATALSLQFFVFAPTRFLFLGEKSFPQLLAALFWNLKNLPEALKTRGKINAVKLS